MAELKKASMEVQAVKRWGQDIIFSLSSAHAPLKLICAEQDLSENNPYQLMIP